MNESLTDKNFMIYAAKYYDNPNCFGEEEFLEDLNRFKYLKKIFTKYVDSGEIKERLVLNHIIILVNVFGTEATCKLLFLKLKGHEKSIKPFLVFLQVLPEKLEDVDNKTIITSEIHMDENIIKILRKI